MTTSTPPNWRDKFPHGLEPVTGLVMVSDSHAPGPDIGEVALIDQHVHGCWLAVGDRRRFENALD